jgi:rhomboid-like protein
MARQYALRQSINNRPRGAQRESPISRMPASSSHAQRYISNGPPRPHSPKQALVDAKEADAVASNFRRMALSDIAYAIGAGILVFGGAVFLARTDTRSLIRATPTIKPSIEGLRATRIRRELLASQRSVNKFRKYINKGLLEYYISWRKTWVNTSDSKRAAYLLVSANLVVFLAWQAVTRGPSLGGSARVFMTRWFVHRPLVVNRLERVITPVTSLFSHQVPLHFLFNMVALTSFSTSAGLYLSSRNVQDGKEYSYRDQQELSGIFHFLAFFVSAGVFASLGGVAHATVLVRKVLRSHPVDFAAYLRVVQSGGLGASGAVFAVFTVATLAHPDTQVALIFVPFVPIAAKYVLMGAVGLDICGLLAGWRYFGHASHLGGVAFGALYFHYGPQMWKAIRGPERAEYLLPRPI